jgi:hypothetical protein
MWTPLEETRNGGGRMHALDAAMVTAFVMIGIVMAADVGITAGGVFSGKFVEVNPVYTGGIPSPFADNWRIIAMLFASKVATVILIVAGIECIRRVGDTCE